MRNSIALLLLINVSLALALPGLPSSPVTVTRKGLDVNWRGRFVHVGLDGIMVHPKSGPKVEMTGKGIDILGSTGVNVHVGLDGVSVIKSDGGLMGTDADKPEDDEAEDEKENETTEQENDSEEETTTASSGVMGYLG